MKNRERKILIGGMVILVIVLIFLFFNRKKEIQIIVPVEKNYLEYRAEPKDQILNKKIEEKTTVSSVDIQKKINESIDVLGRKYKTEVAEGSSVFDLMKVLGINSDQDNLFSFKYTEHSGLGSFVTEINGIKGTPGKYWIYYVNDKLASVGVSKYILKEGDIISWKNEGM